MYHNIYVVPAQEEVILCGMGDVSIDGRPRRHVARSSRLVALVRAEEASVVPLLNRDQRDPWHVVGLQLREKSVIVKVEVGQMVKSVKVKVGDVGSWEP